MTQTSTVVAVVTIVHGRHRHLEAQLDGLRAGHVRPDLYVVVAMGDSHVAEIVARHDTSRSTPVADRVVVVDLPVAEDGLPLAHARNRGAAVACSAGAEVLVFLDVDCIPAPDLVGTYRDTCLDLEREGDGPGVVSGPVHYLPPAPAEGGYSRRDLERSRPHPARPVVGPVPRQQADDVLLFWSLSFALSASAWEVVGGFDEGYVGYGGEDTDFAMRLQQAGGRLWWLRGAVAFHQYHDVESPPRRHLAAIVRNSNAFRDRWGFFPMGGWLAAFEADGLITQAGTPRRWRLTSAGDRAVRSR